MNPAPSVVEIADKVFNRLDKSQGIYKKELTDLASDVECFYSGTLNCSTGRTTVHSGRSFERQRHKKSFQD